MHDQNFPKALTIAAAVSLVLFALTAALWVRSQFASDYAISFSNDTASLKTRGLMVYADDGRLALVSRLYDHPTRTMPDQPWHLDSRRKFGAYNDVRWFRYSSKPGVIAGPPARTDVVLRLWPLALLCSLLPAVWLVIYLRHQPVTGVCRACGCQFRGNTSGACPRCGLQIPITAPEK